MPLPAPTVSRTPKHTRRVHYQGFERADGLWDIEGELHDSKPFDAPHFHREGIRAAGEPIHHMWLRVTVTPQLVVQAIESSMDASPMPHCLDARTALQSMVGCSMARGWRQSIQQHLGGVAGCTHLRELLFNMATAAFQTVTAVFAQVEENQPPRHLGQCTGWAFDGPGVKAMFPQFYGWIAPARPDKPPTKTGTTAPTAPTPG